MAIKIPIFSPTIRKNLIAAFRMGPCSDCSATRLRAQTRLYALEVRRTGNLLDCKGTRIETPIEELAFAWRSVVGFAVAVEVQYRSLCSSHPRVSPYFAGAGTLHSGPAVQIAPRKPLAGSTRPKYCGTEARMSSSSCLIISPEASSRLSTLVFFSPSREAEIRSRHFVIMMLNVKGVKVSKCLRHHQGFCPSACVLENKPAETHGDRNLAD
jgi:hypothetical protein